MSTEIKGAQTALTIREDQTTFTAEQQQALLNHAGVSGNAKSADVEVFFHQVKRTGLDPFAKQIYMIERMGKQTIQTGIDGFRLIARRAVDRTGESLGYEDNLWCDQHGNWRDVPKPGEHPVAAKVTVLRNGERFPAVALFEEYAATKRDGSLTQMWKDRPAGQLAKCAEALALRKAFPQDLSGLYTAEEMQQADNSTPAPRQTTPTPAPTASSPGAASASSPDTAGPSTPDQPAERLQAIWDDPAAIDSALPWLRSNRPELAEKAAARLAEFEAADNTETEGQTSIEDAEIVEDTNE